MGLIACSGMRRRETGWARPAVGCSRRDFRGTLWHLGLSGCIATLCGRTPTRRGDEDRLRGDVRCGYPRGMFESVPTLRGSHVTLRPVEVADARALFEVTPPETFRLCLSWPTEWTAAGFEAWVKAKLFGAKQRAMVATLTRTGAVVGSTSFLDVDSVNKAVEVGSTWYTPSVRGTMVNPECKLLMLGHAFEVEGCERVTLKTDDRNEHSKRAMTKLGAVYEGVLRRHRIQQDGFVRDTAYFSVVRSEWPAVKTGLQKRLSECRTQ